MGFGADIQMRGKHYKGGCCMKNDKSKKVTYTVKTGDELELSREVERGQNPLLRTISENLFEILVFATIWLLFVLMFG